MLCKSALFDGISFSKLYWLRQHITPYHLLRTLTADGSVAYRTVDALSVHLPLNCRFSLFVEFIATRSEVNPLDARYCIVEHSFRNTLGLQCTEKRFLSLRASSGSCTALELDTAWKRKGKGFGMESVSTIDSLLYSFSLQTAGLSTCRFMFCIVK